MVSSNTELEEALAAYRTRMSASNREFWTTRITTLEGDPSLTERRRLDILAYHFHIPKWPQTGHASNITSPRQILIPLGEEGHVELGIDNDGTVRPVSSDSRQAFLDGLTALLDQHFPEVPPPEEYQQLLELADAISDLDFAHIGAADLQGVCGGTPGHNSLSNRLAENGEWRSQGWAVYGGWQCGLGDMAGVQLLYSNKPDGEEEQQELKWRVYSFDQSNWPEGRWFESIVDYLGYRAAWLERLPSGWESSRTAEQVEEDEEVDEDEDDDE